MRKYTVYRKGERIDFESPLSDAEAMQGLAELAETNSFAASLLEQSKSRGLTERQVPWVHKLVLDRATPPKATAEDLDGLVRLMAKGHEHLKRPKLTFSLSNGDNLVIKLAGPQSRNPGMVYVLVNAEYVGKISPEGHLIARNPPPDYVPRLLRKLAQNPAQAAHEYGILTGRCVFCTLPLSDPRSTEVGYGKTCAGHYGLPWGKEWEKAKAKFSKQAQDAADELFYSPEMHYA